LIVHLPLWWFSPSIQQDFFFSSGRSESKARAVLLCWMQVKAACIFSMHLSARDDASEINYRRTSRFYSVMQSDQAKQKRLSNSFSPIIKVTSKASCYYMGPFCSLVRTHRNSKYFGRSILHA
jgi:hypothetical protein